MSTPPETPESSESPKSADGPKFYFVAVYPLVAGVALWIVGFFALMGLMYSEASYAVLFVLGAAVVIGGGHFWFKWILEGRNEPRPWQYPAVLSTALVAAVVVALASVSLDPGSVLALPLVCVGLCLLGAAVFSQVGERHRFISALTTIVVAALLLIGRAWWADAQDQEERKEELLQDVSDFPHEIAVLDLPGWEPTAIRASEDLGTASIEYEPTDPSPELDGFSLALQSESMEEIAETGWTPLYSLCESDGGDYPCEEDGDVVVADMSDNTRERFEARTEFTDGGAAELSTDLPTDENGEPAIGFPDIDMVDLAEQIRSAEPGEAEEIVEDVFR